MASAVLASRNEQPCWGERRVSMKKFTNSTPNNPHHLTPFNPNPNSSFNPSNPSSNQPAARRIHDFPINNHVRKCEEPSSARCGVPAAAVSSKDSLRKGVTFNGQKESAFGQYVIYNLAEYSTKGLKELKLRLRSELEKVRSFRGRIEVPDLQYIASQTSSSYGRIRDVSRPDDALDFPASGVAVCPKEKRPPKLDQQQQQRPSEFEGKKNPKILGQKRALPVSSTGGDLKLVSSMMKRCSQMLTKLMKHKHGWVFNKPVDAERLGLHDYHQIIKHAMDLGTVKSRLQKNVYVSPLDFASDVRLTFRNAMTYNLKGQDVHTMADTLLSLFEQMFNPAYQKYETEQQRVLVAEQSNWRAWAPTAAPVVESSVWPEPVMIAKKSDSVVSEPSLSNPVQVQLQASPSSATVAATAKKPKGTPRSNAKLPKPKAKDLNKRAMSFDEKAKLSVGLQNLPPEKMDQLVQILRKRNSHLSQDDDDEIELEIEVLDNETLWELDRFVSYHKKAVSKMRRQGLIDNVISSAQISKSPIRELTLEFAVQQKVKKGDAGEEDVDIGEEIPVNDFPPVEIEKDAVGASSSSSSSSSSGSDSSSSSGSDSASSSGSDSADDSVRSPCVESKETAVT